MRAPLLLPSHRRQIRRVGNDQQMSVENQVLVVFLILLHPVLRFPSLAGSAGARLGVLRLEGIAGGRREPRATASAKCTQMHSSLCIC